MTIADLIAAGRLEEALDLLAKTGSNDAILLKSRYANGARQYNMGLVDFGEWSRIQNQVSFAALEMAGKISGGSQVVQPQPVNPQPFQPQPVNPPAPQATAAAAKRVFISYNQQDKDMCDRVKAYLDNKGLDVTIDREKMEAGQSIKDFIQNNIRTNGYIVSLVSENSLKSGWVGMESTAALFAEWMLDAHFIPVALDHRWGENEFYLEALESINAKVKKKEQEKAKAKKLGGRTTHIETQIDRLLDLKANLSAILDKFQGVLTVSIADPDFDKNMEKVAKRILA